MPQFAGRRLAPFLRVLLPSWWLARFDSHPDAASAATAAMRAAFSGHKQREALLFCRNEVPLPLAFEGTVLPMFAGMDLRVLKHARSRVPEAPHMQWCCYYKYSKATVLLVNRTGGGAAGGQPGSHPGAAG